MLKGPVGMVVLMAVAIAAVRGGGSESAEGSEAPPANPPEAVRAARKSSGRGCGHQ